MPIDQILDGLYLGNQFSAENKPGLVEAGITHILSVTNDEIAYPDDLGLVIKRVELGDYAHENVIPLFPETNEFIGSAIKDGGTVLVHCTLGMSRSATMVIAYLMKSQSKTFSEAIAYVYARRGIINPNAGYREQLEIYSQSGCDVQVDNALFTEWKRKRNEIIRRSPAEFSAGVAGDLKREINVKPIENKNMALIMNGLWLGDRFAAQNGVSLARAGITHILSVTTDSIPYPRDQGLKIKRVEIEDYPDEKIIPLLADTNKFIDDAIKGGGSVLVHCTQGVSRSASIVAAYLMKTYPETSTVQQAIVHLQSRRSVVRPNPGFMEQLEIYEQAGYDITTDNVRYKEWQAKSDQDFQAKMQQLGL